MYNNDVDFIDSHAVWGAERLLCVSLSATKIPFEENEIEFRFN